MQNHSSPAPHRPEKQPERYSTGELAQRYDVGVRKGGLLRRFSHWMELNALLRALKRLDGDAVLDAPCGTGRIHEILKQHFREVTSMDSSQSMLDVHRQNTGSDRLYCGDIFDMEFADNQFDWVVCYRLYHHLQSESERVLLLKELQRVCRKGVVFTAWIQTPFNRRGGSRRRTLSMAELQATISQAGLKYKTIDYSMWPFQPKCVITCEKPTGTGTD